MYIAKSINESFKVGKIFSSKIKGKVLNSLRIFNVNNNKNARYLHKIYMKQFSNDSMDPDNYFKYETPTDEAQKIFQNSKEKGKGSMKVKDLLKALDTLERAKIGISFSNKDYDDFLNDIPYILLRKEVKAKDLDRLIDKITFLNVQNNNVWNILYSKARVLDFAAYPIECLSIYTKLLKKQRNKQLLSILKDKEPMLRREIMKNLRNFKLKQWIEVNFIYLKLGYTILQLTSGFRNCLMDTLYDLEMKVDANDIVLASFVAYYIIPNEDIEKIRIMRDLAQGFINRDSIEYDLTLQHDEFVEYEQQGDHGIKDRLTWETLSFIASIYTKSDIFDPNLLKRLEELILRKSETDIIDIDNASIILSSFGKCTMIKLETSIYLRLLEMINWQIQNENATIVNQFDGRNISEFLSGILRLYNNEWDPVLTSTLFIYFGQILTKDEELQKRISKDNWGLLYYLFKDAERLFNVDKAFSDFSHKQAL